MSSNNATDNPQAGAGRPLPKKEADTFRNVVKHYEMKQYKKAIKQADSILKKFPKHGETLAMKGLTLNYMNKRDEAHALVKQGLMNDMRYVSIVTSTDFNDLRSNPYWVSILTHFFSLPFPRYLFSAGRTFVGTSTACCIDPTTITTKPSKPTNRPCALTRKICRFFEISPCFRFRCGIWRALLSRETLS